MKQIFAGCLCLLIMCSVTSAQEEIWMPDPNLRSALREVIGAIELTQQNLQALTYLNLQNKSITNITGLEHARNLRELHISQNPISDISALADLTQLVELHFWHIPAHLSNLDLRPLVNLTNLEVLSLQGNGITDISPLAGLRNLRSLHIMDNQIEDFNPLIGLTNLQQLWITGNWARDLSMLDDLNLTTFEHDEFCIIEPLGPSVVARIASRNLPSVFQAWDNLIGSEDAELYADQIARHDLHWSSFFQLQWDTSGAEPTYGLSTRLGGDMEKAKAIREQRLLLNPNMVFLVEIRLHNYFGLDALPPDSNFWLRNTIGANIKNSVAWDEYSLDILNSELQQLLINRIVGIAECGLFDGVLLDGFLNQGAGYYSHLNIGTDEEIIEAHAQILKGVREQVRDDFLILVNAGDGKVPVHSEYVNGSFMEIGPWHQGGYSDKYLQAVEDTLLWNEKNLRSPQINSLRPQGFGQYAPDAPENKRWMRLFTTMSLTHSDGYILYTTGRSDFFNGFDEKGDFIPHHEHIWYDFWNAPLGRPIGGDESKGVLHKTSKGGTIDGLFIREFTNGWAVYNRSGKSQEIRLPEQATGVGSELRNTTHIIPDLDGEIYLKSALQTPPTVDVNGDGTVNILDLVAVANGFGKDTPDVNGDGVVNVLDLVAVANAFGQ
ncbi:hypothetical protein C6500_14585 [Candidatus Poribacteria bacterium]|nr:MAG: hypothetical protein C6500_14585 [Candidatus Poribacteria bacterium]